MADDSGPLSVRGGGIGNPQASGTAIVLQPNLRLTVPANPDRHALLIGGQGGIQGDWQLVLDDGFGNHQTIFDNGTSAVQYTTNVAELNSSTIGPFTGRVQIFSANTTDQFYSREW
jgi:hypothetical protein